MPALPDALARDIEALAHDNVSGAITLMARATEAVRRSADQLASPALLDAAARALVAAQPTMAPLAHLAERLRNSGDTSRAIRAACDQLLEEIEASEDAVTTQALSLFKGAETVLTHSYSSNVAATLESAQRQSKLARVICTESRPIGEGTALAHRLAQQRIPVHLIIDAAVARVINEATLVLVGADAVSQRGLVNKVGSRLVALAAREQKVPMYAVFTTLKVLPEGYELGPERVRSGSEIADIPGCRVRNYYFETTPLELLAGVVTEEGVRHHA